jgi:hypothetical protein
MYIGHGYTLREIRKTREEVHMGYNKGNSPTYMGANGLKVFKILTFRPSKKE